MNRAAKSYLTAGVALAGASVIAVSPVVATPLSPPGVNTHPAFSVSTADLQLATTVNPIAAWAEVVSAAYGNVAALGEEVLSDPAPILRQFILNQLSNGEAVVSAATGAIGGFLEYISPDNAFGLGAQLRTAAEQLSSGNIAGAIETATQALFLAPVISVAFPVLSSGLLEIPGTIAQNFASSIHHGRLRLRQDPLHGPLAAFHARILCVRLPPVPASGRLICPPSGHRQARG